MPVVKLYQNSMPSLSLSTINNSRYVFRFYTVDQNGNNQQLIPNLGVTSAQIIIDSTDPIIDDLDRQANGDFVWFVPAGAFDLAVGIYTYGIYIDGDTVPYLSGQLAVGVSLQQDQAIGILDASRNAVLVNNTIYENPAFADTTTALFSIVTVDGIDTIGVNVLPSAPAQVYNAVKQILQEGANVVITPDDDESTLTISVDLSGYQLTDEKNAANGYAGLNSSSQVVPSQIPIDDVTLKIESGEIVAQLATEIQAGIIRPGSGLEIESDGTLNTIPLVFSDNFVGDGAEVDPIDLSPEILDLINGAQQESEKNQPNGYPGLNGSSKINANQVPLDSTTLGVTSGNIFAKIATGSTVGVVKPGDGLFVETDGTLNSIAPVDFYFDPENLLPPGDNVFDDLDDLLAAANTLPGNKRIFFRGETDAVLPVNLTRSFGGISIYPHWDNIENPAWQFTSKAYIDIFPVSVSIGWKFYNPGNDADMTVYPNENKSMIWGGQGYIQNLSVDSPTVFIEGFGELTLYIKENFNIPFETERLIFVQADAILNIYIDPTIIFDIGTRVNSEVGATINVFNWSTLIPTDFGLGTVNITNYFENIPGNAATATALQTGRTIAITGDLAYTSPPFTGTSNITAAGTLATVNSNVGTFGSATQVPVVTVNAKGLTTAVSNTSIQITESQVTNLTTDLAAKAASGANTDITSVQLDADGLNVRYGDSNAFLRISPDFEFTQTRILNISLGDQDRILIISGNSTISGTNTGDQTSVTGNAGTATALQTGRTIAITGDMTGTSGSFDGTSNASIAGTLATVNSNVGSFGSATQVGSFTVNGKGLITAASNTSIAIAQSAVTNLVTDLANKEPLQTQIQIRWDAFAGYGSTDNKIPYFTNKNTDVGSSGNITITSNNSTNGLSLTINTAGNYSISFWSNYSAVSSHGLSLNSNQLTTSIASITAVNRLAMATSGAANFSVFVSWSGWLGVNDVIRPHTDGTSVGTAPAAAGFSIAKI